MAAGNKKAVPHAGPPKLETSADEADPYGWRVNSDSSSQVLTS